jgi:hypothetical protein
MIPTLRKSGLTPDQKMRMQLYSLLGPLPLEEKSVNIIGSNLPTVQESELVTMIREGGYCLREIHWCETFDGYLEMASSALNLIYEPIALIAGEDMKKRLGQSYLYLPNTFQYDVLEETYQKLADTLHIDKPDCQKWRQKAESALIQTKDCIGDTPIAVDATFTFRILDFTRMLLEHGFHVTEIYGDSFLPEERENFEWIQANYPEILISSCSRPKMRFLKRQRPEKVLAIGQKAAYFTGTDYFVNVVEGGGFYGYHGIVQIANLMQEAFYNKKDRKIMIQRKGWGCESCI